MGDQGSESARLLRACRRNPDAFAEFYDRHARRLFGWLMNETRNLEIAADLMAETFAQALLSARTFRGSTTRDVEAWLFGISRNLLAQYRRRRVVEARARERLRIPRRSYIEDGFEEVENRLAAGRLEPRLQDELNSLAPENASALKLRVVDEMGYDEIAKVLDCTPTAARMRVSRALGTLSTRLRRTNDEDA
jgi:RNA polymerase sigma factor (sigma-70 family)